MEFGNSLTFFMENYHVYVIQVYQTAIGKHSQKKLPDGPEPSAGYGPELAQREDLILMFC